MNLLDPTAAVSPSSEAAEPAEPNAPLLAPAWEAGFLLAASHYGRAHGLQFPSAATILEATGAGRTRAYEMRGRVFEGVAGLQRPTGRPPAPPRPPLPAELRAELSGHMLSYLIDHPGAVTAGPVRRRYSDGARRFVLELRERYPDLPLSDFALALQIPADTLADWLNPPFPPTEPEPEPDAEPEAERGPERGPEREPGPDHDTPTSPLLPRIESVLQAWKTWDGSFTDFCHHIRHNLRIDWGRTFISLILEQHGMRTPDRRPGRRSSDEHALRNQFETFFPGAQWGGDGSPIAVEVCGQRFAFNLELITDTDSGAFPGFDIRDHEDSHAVTQAFHDGIRTTGDPPLALLLDNRPSNHTPDVLDALGDTLLIPTTLRRPQNNGHVEGGFGLFQQMAPPLVLHGSDLRSLARQLLALTVQTWARTLNHRPRSDRQGRSRVQIYLDAAPTPEDIEHARAALNERLRRQQLANQTRKRRLDPTVRHALEQAFDRFGLDDPTGNLKDAIAAYPPDSVVDAIGVFKAKHEAGTLPPDVDARYLLGITRNLAEEREGIEIAHALLRERIAARDHALQRLDSRRLHLLDHLNPDDSAPLLIAFVDHALASPRGLDRLFWLQAAADAALANPLPSLSHLFRTAARRIHSTHAVPHKERLAATRFLAAQLFPLDRPGPNP